MHEEIQMKTSRYTEPQILSILRQAKGGVPVAELCREHGMSNGLCCTNQPEVEFSLPLNRLIPRVEFAVCQVR